MSHEHRVERVEAQAKLDMFRAAPRPLAEAVGLETFALGDGLGLLAARIDDGQFNRVFCLGLDEPVRPEHLDEAARRYRPHNLTKARFQPTPRVAAQPGLSEQLAGRGMVRTPGGTTKRVRPTDTLPEVSTDLAIVDAQAAPDQFSAVAAAGFGMPPSLQPWLEALVGRPDWRCFVAMDGDRPVGAAALYLADDGGWLGIGATLPDARSRGAQGALMRARIAAARDAGKAWVVTETGAPLPGEAPGPSYRNMDRHGFVEVHLRPSYTI